MIKILMISILSLSAMGNCSYQLELGSSNLYKAENIRTAKDSIISLLQKKDYTLDQAGQAQSKIELAIYPESEEGFFFSQSIIRLYKGDRLEYYTRGLSKYSRSQRASLSLKKILTSVEIAISHLPSCEHD